MTQIRTLDLRSQSFSESEVSRILPRAKMDTSAASQIAAPIVDSIRTNGLAAIRAQSIEIDGFDPDPVRVGADEIQHAVSALDSELRKALETAINRNRKVSEAAMPRDFSVEISPGAVVSQRYVPIESVGLYAPGGRAVYPSSVVMNVVPAQVAGVPSIFLASPGQKAFDGRPHPTVLAVAGLLGVENVFCMGGPSAIAAFTFGVSDIQLPPVGLIAGPGNSYVAAAKRIVSDFVAIDSEAGTTEIMIIADEDAHPRYVAADLISQAEHDPNAAAVLITPSKELIDEVLIELQTQVEKAKYSDRIIQALGGQQSALVLVDNLDQAAQLANAYATEHLELLVADPGALAQKITNAAAIFLGEYSPVSLGDYLAGSSHVLPTGGKAKFQSGLGVHTFLRPQQIINFGQSGLAEVKDQLQLIASAEDLPAHGEAVAKRFN